MVVRKEMWARCLHADSEAEESFVKFLTSHEDIALQALKGAEKMEDVRSAQNRLQFIELIRTKMKEVKDE